MMNQKASENFKLQSRADGFFLPSTPDIVTYL